MTKFFGDLELPNNIFEKKIVNKDTEATVYKGLQAV